MTSFQLRRIKCVIYRLDTIFSKTQVAQLMVFKTNFCLRDIRSANSNAIPCPEVKKWQWLIVSMWHLVHIYLEKLQMHTEVSQISNLRSLDVSKEILPDLVREDVAKFNNKFYHFQDAALEMFKGTFRNYSVLKLRFFHQHSYFCSVL